MRLSSISFDTIRHHYGRFYDSGLYGGARIFSGHRVSSFGNKHNRKFELNLQWSSLYSERLQRCVRVRVTTTVLKTIDAVGGLDNYIMGQRRLDGLKAEALKKALVLRQWQSDLALNGINLKYQLLNCGKRV